MPYPGSQDELCWLGGIDSLYEEGVPQDVYNPGKLVVYSPHLFLQLCHLSYWMFGQGIFSARIPGLLAGLGSLILIFFIVRSLVTGSAGARSRWAALSMMLCAALPVMVQANAVIDIDTSILIPLVILLCLAVYRQLRNPNWKNCILTALVFALSLWGRITTPVILVPAFLAFGWFCSKSVKSFLRISLALIAGAALFTATWSIYCLGTETPFSGPFEYTASAFFNRVGGSGSLDSGKLILNGAHLVLWLGLVPFAFLSVIFSARLVEVVRSRALRPEDLFLACGLVIVCGYTVVGGTPFGFPKYHCPGFPLLCISAGWILSRMNWDPSQGIRRPAALVLVFLAAGAVQWLLFGDMLYVLRVNLREAQALGIRNPSEILRDCLFSAGIACGAWLVLWGLLILGSTRIRVRPALLVICLGSGFGAIALQNTAHCNTGYNYGLRCAPEVAAFLEKRLGEDETLLAPSEIVYLLKRPGVEHLPNRLWLDPAGMTSRLSDPRNRALAISIHTNTVTQLRIIHRHPAVQSVLCKEYTFRRIGSFQVWTRK